MQWALEWFFCGCKAGEPRSLTGQIALLSTEAMESSLDPPTEQYLPSYRKNVEEAKQHSVFQLPRRVCWVFGFSPTLSVFSGVSGGQTGHSLEFPGFLF